MPPTLDAVSRRLDLLGVYPLRISGDHDAETSCRRGWNGSVRYALVVTIHTPDTEVDIYTPVATRVGIEIEV